MGHFSEQNFYEILEVSSDATSEEIQKAFFRAKATYSPNSPALYSVFSEEEAKALLQLIDEAYSVLSNHAKRRDYDKNLFGGLTKNTSNPQDSGSTLPTDLGHDLPDFMLPADAPKSGATVPPDSMVSKNVATTPIGNTNRQTGRTIVSHFQVDENFEREIQAQETFDGTFLQRVRLYKNVSLDQLSETSRINRSYLLAVETNDFHSLPASVYVRGFITSIARLLGLDEKKVADSYMKIFKESRGK